MTNKAPSVTVKHLAAEIAEKHGMTKKLSEAIISDLSSRLTENLAAGHTIRWPNVGTFQVRKRPARMGRNPATGQQMQFKASSKVAFKASKELREATGGRA